VNYHEKDNFEIMDKLTGLFGASAADAANRAVDLSNKRRQVGNFQQR